VTRDEIVERVKNNPGREVCYDCGAFMDKYQAAGSREICGWPLCGFCFAIWLSRGEREKTYLSQQVRQ